MTIRRVKPIARATTPIKRSRLRQGKGAKAERETPALDAFRFAVFENARGWCEVETIAEPRKPFPFYDRLSVGGMRERICGTAVEHRGDNAHHVWPEDRDGGHHEADRGLWLCFRAHRFAHDNPAEAKRLGLLRPDIPEGEQ